jgi:hypothetical protein
MANNLDWSLSKYNRIKLVRANRKAFLSRAKSLRGKKLWAKITGGYSRMPVLQSRVLVSWVCDRFGRPCSLAWMCALLLDFLLVCELYASSWYQKLRELNIRLLSTCGDYLSNVINVNTCVLLCANCRCLWVVLECALRAFNKSS